VGFTTSNLPEMRFGIGSLVEVGAHAAAISKNGKATIIADRFLLDHGVVARVIDSLAMSDVATTVFAEFTGEPKECDIMSASRQARHQDSDLVVAIGGGSALDIGKTVACTALGNQKPSYYAMATNPMPETVLPSILIPTTAGTGSEANGTAIFSNGNGKKVWLANRKAKACLALLDPGLSQSLPADLTAWCGMDALVHAFEAAVSRRTHPGGQIFAHKALRLIVGSLERACANPDDLSARSDMLLGSFYAGFAIENCGTGIAHNISHALARFAPIHHGFATAIGFEATLGWLVEHDNSNIETAATICGLSAPDELPNFISNLMDRLEFDRSLPPGFEGLTVDELYAEMSAPENRPMRDATPRMVSDADLRAFAETVVTLSA